MKQKVKKIIQNKKNLAENEVKDLLKEYNIKTTNYQLIKDEKDIKNLQLDFPVALKVCSSEILHKTDVGGVKLNISSKNELKKHVKQFKEKFPDENLLVDEMVDSGVEVITGLTQDPTFGLTIMVGVGGIYTELYEDVSFRVVPIEEYDAYEMLDEIKGKKLLEGFRGIKADKQQVINLLLKISDLGEELIEHVDEMDLNPVFIYEDDYCVVDAKMVLQEN
ncbi:MAG: acetate--CoA ligase family protein [Candidatus Thermoplasmatota archaeon]